MTEQAIQLLGRNGYTREYPVERWHRDTKIFTIYRVNGVPVLGWQAGFGAPVAVGNAGGA